MSLLFERGDDRFLERVFGRVEIAEGADERREHLSRLFAEQVLVGRHYPMSTTGRTSTLPVRAPGILAASSMARSRSFTSTT